MAAETNLSELCRGSDIGAILTRLRQVAPLDESQPAGNTTSVDSAALQHSRRQNLWGYQDNDGRTAFHWAIALKNFELARNLMNPPYSSPVLTEDEEWGTPFATACSVGAPLDLLSEILEKSIAELAEYARWKKELTPAAEAKPGGDASTKEGNADVPVQQELPGISMPKEATPESIMAAVIDTTDSAEQTPLLLAAGRGHSNIVRFLVDHGADLNHQNSRGQSALHRAVNRGSMDLVEYLVTASQKKNGTNKAAQRRFLDLQDFRGDSALFYASMDNNEEIGRYLLRRGADRELRNKDGKNFWEV